MYYSWRQNLSLFLQQTYVGLAFLKCKQAGEVATSNTPDPLSQPQSWLSFSPSLCHCYGRGYGANIAQALFTAHPGFVAFFPCRETSRSWWKCAKTFQRLQVHQQSRLAISWTFSIFFPKLEYIYCLIFMKDFSPGRLRNIVCKLKRVIVWLPMWLENWPCFDHWQLLQVQTQRENEVFFWESA